MLRGSLARVGLRHRAWRYGRRVDPDGIRWMRASLRPGDVAVDAGAYKGGYTFWMRKEVGATGAVIAFEPQPELAAYLRRCVGRFGWKNVTVVEACLSSRPGERTLRVPGERPSPGASLLGAALPEPTRDYPVAVETLDRWLSGHRQTAPVAFIKCDVEGHELDVLAGARETLSAHRPRILLECEARHDPSRRVEDVFDALRGMRYRGSFFWRGEALDVSGFVQATHQVPGRKPYANNFLFEPLGKAP